MREEDQSAATLEAPSTISTSPIEALASITPKPTATDGTVRNDKGQFTAKEKAEQAAVKEAAVDAQMRAEFPELYGAKPAQEQPEAGATSPAEGSKKAKTEQPIESAQVTARQDARAIDWLKRAQISQARIDALSPAERVAWAKDIKPMVVAQQQATQQGKSQSRPETITEKDAGSPAGEPHDSLQLDLKEAVEDLKKDVDPAVVAKLEKLLMAAVTPLQKKLAAAEASAMQAGEAQLKRDIDASREALVDRFPELADDETWDEDVMPMVRGLASTGKFSQADLKRLVTKAALAADLDEVTQQAKDDNETVARLRANGTASSRTKGVSNPVQSKDDRITLAAKLALDPTVSVEEARRRVWDTP